MSVLLEARALDVGYEGRAVATVASLSVGPGERLWVAGPNGSGKTTLLKTLARLLPPVSGELSGPAPGPRGAVYVHPAPHLYAGTGLDNVMLGAHGARAAAEEAIDLLQAASFARADVRTLSNGQRQRIALARALAARPVLLLIDEADSGLDVDGRAAWQQVVASRGDIAIVAASHAREGAAVILPG